MVRGNWQKRIERTEAKRQEAKQAKQKKQDRRLFKQHAQKLLHALDKHGSPCRPLRLHIWTDAFTSTIPLLIVDAESHDGTGVGGGKKKGRNRSNSNAGEQMPKKAHPRSKEAASHMPDDDEAQVPLACRSHFFHDKCSSSSTNITNKKGCGCSYNHYVAPFRTLASVVKDKEALESAMSAAVESTPEDFLETQPNAMEMLNYRYLELRDVPTDGKPTQLSDEIIRDLLLNDIKIANLVYVAVNEILVYDRFREGLILNDREIAFAISGHDALGKRRISVGSEEEVAGGLTKLPGSILELTLTYLPDSAVTVFSSVCKDWHTEIGYASPNLWRNLLERRNWPVPEGPGQSHQEFRKAFLEHYTAVRDLKAVKLAMTALSNRKVQQEREMCYQLFATRRDSPSPENGCASVQNWSSNRVLVAYGKDCSLRLFEAVPKSDDEKLCKQIVYQRIDPYKNTKKRRCVLTSMVLDELCIGCLCLANTDVGVLRKYILVVVSREDFLLGESSVVGVKGGDSGDVNLDVIDIGEATINYFLSEDIADHTQLELMDFLQCGGEISEIAVVPRSKLVACGNGRFLVEVSLSVPLNDEANDDVDTVNQVVMREIARKLVLFSTSVGAIIWVHDRGDAAWNDTVILTSAYNTTPGERRPICNFLVASRASPDLCLGSIDASSSVVSPALLEGSLLVRSEVVGDGWEVRGRLGVALTKGHAIAADVLRKGMLEKSIVSLYPLQQQSELYHTVEVAKMQVNDLTILRDSHIALVCKESGNDSLEHFNSGSFWLILIHIASRKEIYRCPTGVDNPELLNSLFDATPKFSTQNGSTIGCALDWRGVAITGDDVRHMDTSDLRTDADHPNLTKKKKKKKPFVVAKGSKKDGFARGMSLRG